jgi:hypothetical protein
VPGVVLPRYVRVGSLFVGATESPQIADSSYFQIIGDYCMLSCLESTAGRCVVRKVGVGGGRRNWGFQLKDGVEPRHKTKNVASLEPHELALSDAVHTGRPPYRPQLLAADHGRRLA